MIDKNSNDSFPVDELIAFFSDGHRRFLNTEVSLRLSWFPDSPDISDELMSNYGVSGEGNPFSSEFFEEIEAITKLLEQKNIRPELASWQKTDMPAAERMYQGLNRRAMALSIWDWYANPLRLKGEMVYRIWAPKDVMGTPIIKALRLDYFLSLVAKKTAHDLIEQARSKKRIEGWQGATVILGMIVLTLILYLFR